MLRLALKSVRHNPKRLILTALAVALGVALVAATLTFTSALSRGFTDLFGDIYGSVDVIAEPAPVETDANDFGAGGTDALFSASDIEAIQQVDGVLYAEGTVGYEEGQVLNADGDGPLGQGAPTLVYRWSGIADIDGSTVIDGAAPSADGEVVVDIDTYAKLDLAPGDTVKIGTEQGVKELTVSGSIRFGDSNELQTANLMFANEATIRDLAGGFEGFTDVQIVAEDGASPDAIVSDLGPLLPDGTRAITSQDKIAEQVDTLNEALNIIDVFALIFGLVALFVGDYIIVNTFRIIVTQRTREFGLLRAIGAQGSQIRNSILVESIVVALVGATFGILIGWGLALAGGAIVEVFSGNILGPLLLPVKALLWSYSLGLAVTVVAALLPAIHASRISPMEALREAGTAGKKSLVVRNIVGGAMTLLGVAAVLFGLYATPPKPYWWVGAGAVLIVLGVTLLAAQVIVPLAYGLRGVLTKLWGVNGKLAANNIHREPRRSANTAAALMIGVMLLALVATFTESLTDTFTSQFATNQAELLVPSTTGPIPQGALDVIANTVLLSVTERTLEIGLLRAVGVTRKAVWGMITLESVVMAVFGTILGIILGVGLGAALVDSLGEYGFERVVIPWIWIAVYTVLSMIAGVLAAIWPAWRASKLDILKA